MQSSIHSRVAQRRVEIQRARRRRWVGHSLLAVTMIVLLPTALWVERSPMLALSSLEVVGTERLLPETVREAAALPLGTSTLRLRLGEARQRVEALPLVRSATVSRVDPLSVRVEVVERRPMFVLSTAGGDALVDADGVVVGSGRLDGLPLITTTVPTPPVPGSTVVALPEAADAFAIASGLPGPLRVEVTRYEVIRPGEVDLVLASGLRARFGQTERVREKARVLGVLLSELGPRADGATIDVRAPSNPVLIATPRRPARLAESPTASGGSRERAPRA